MKQFQEVNLTMMDRFRELEAPKKLILDIDSTNSATNGDQLGSAYNSHYNLHNGLHRFCLPKKMKKHRIQTVRMQLIKIAGKITRSGRYIQFKLSSSSVYKKAFFSTLQRIQRLSSFG